MKKDIIEVRWLDNVTFLMVFRDEKDTEGDIYHMESEYHIDEDKMVYTKVYEHEVIQCEEKDIQEYVIPAVAMVFKII